MEQPRIINNRIFYDERGSFSPLSLFELDKEWKQSNISVNPKKFTLRGLHYQTGETSQTKLVKVINGKILDFVVDLRVPLRTYNNCQFFEMKGGDFYRYLFNLDENDNPKYSAVDPMGGPFIGVGMDMGYIHDDLKGLIVESIDRVENKIILNTKRI